VHRVVTCLLVWSLVMGAASGAWAGWVWRNGRWIYEETPSPPPKATPKPAPKPAPAPRQERGQPPASPAAPGPKAPKAESSPPAPPGPKPSSGAKQKAPAPAERLRPGGRTPPPRTPPAAAPREAVPRPLPDTEKPNRTEPEEKPWYERAKWWAKPPAPGGDADLWKRGQAQFDARDYGRAEKTLARLIKDYPQSPYRAEAMWLRAEALFARQRYYKAYEQYEDLIKQYAGSPRYHQALRREIEIAELYLGPVRRRVLGIPLLSGETEALEILRRVYEHQPTGDLADDVVLRIADYYWSKRRWEDAEEYYDKYCKEYPNGEAIRHAELRRAQCTINQCKGPTYDTTPLRLAEDRLRQFQEKYPQDAVRHGVPALIERVRDLQAQSLYEIAARYWRAGRPCAAAFYAETLRRQFPSSTWAAKAEALVSPDTEPKAPAEAKAGREVTRS